MTIRIKHLPLASAVCALVWAGALSAQQAGPMGGKSGPYGSPGAGGQSPYGMSQQQSRQAQQGTEQRGQQQGGSSAGVFDPNRDMIYLPKEKTAMFERLDANQDSEIDQQEAQENDRLSQRFDDIDSDSNGRMTRSEFSMFELEEGEKTDGKEQRSGEGEKKEEQQRSGEGESGSSR